MEGFVNKNNSFDSINGTLRKKSVLLLIVDGWGLSPSWGGNAIAFANPINFHKLWKTYPHVVLQAFRGITDQKGNVGNSEIGHASIGTGRIVKQDITEINEAIKRGYFFQNPVLLEAFNKIRKFKSNLHLIGLLSDGGVHSHFDHLVALLRLAKLEKINNVYIHIISDGIDTPDRSAINYISKLKKIIKNLGVGKIASICGRYFAMDKSGRTNLIEKAYLLQTKGKGNYSNDIDTTLKKYYSQGITDNMIPPTIISEGNNINIVKDYDSLIFFNFRADRATDLTRAYVDLKYFRNIVGRKHRLIKDLYFVSLTSYMLEDGVKVNIAFPSVKIEDSLSAMISRAGLKQFHVAETEKSAHVSYFFNGGVQEAYQGEDRFFVKSPNVKSYSQIPQMSTQKLADVIIKAIKSENYHFIVANIANVDMVAHTGDIQATTSAIRFTDSMIGKIVQANHNNITIITSDHGNAEEIIPYKSISNRATFHTTNPVPFIFIKKNLRKDLIKNAIVSNHVPMYDVLESPYNLADIAPTILDVFNINKPQGMTGQSLLKTIGYK